MSTSLPFWKQNRVGTSGLPYHINVRLSSPPLEHFFDYPHPSITFIFQDGGMTSQHCNSNPTFSGGHSLIKRSPKSSSKIIDWKTCRARSLTLKQKQFLLRYTVGKKLSKKNIDHFFYLCSFETGFCFDQWRMEYRSQAWHHFMSKLCRSWFARSEGFQRVIPSWCCRKCFDTGGKIAWFLYEHRTGEWEVGETFLKSFIIHEEKIEFL